VGDAASARRGTASNPVALALLLVVGGCAHSTLPECPAPKPVEEKPSQYAEYFRAVKARVFQNWQLNAVLKEHDPKRTQFGARDRYTILEVTLDAAGAISTMTLRRTSGLAFLDEAAMDAIRRAAPFEPPPPGLLRADGTVQFPFGFYMESPGSPPRCRPRGEKTVEAMSG